MHQSYPITQIIPNIFHKCLLYAMAIISCAGFTFHTFQILSMIRTTSYHIKKIHLESSYCYLALLTQGRTFLVVQLLALCSSSILPKKPYTNKLPVIPTAVIQTICFYSVVFPKDNIHAVIQPLTSVKFLQTPLDLVFRGIHILNRISLYMDKPIIKLIVAMYLCMLVSLYASCFAYAAIITNELNSDASNPRRRYKRRYCISENTFNSINCYAALIYLVFAAGINSIEGAGFYDSFGLVFLSSLVSIELAYSEYTRWGRRRYRYSTGRYYVLNDDISDAFRSIVWRTFTDSQYLYAVGYKNWSYTVLSEDVFKRE